MSRTSALEEKVGAQEIVILTMGKELKQMGQALLKVTNEIRRRDKLDVTMGHDVQHVGSEKKDCIKYLVPKDLRGIGPPGLPSPKDLNKKCDVHKQDSGMAPVYHDGKNHMEHASQDASQEPDAEHSPPCSPEDVRFKEEDETIYLEDEDYSDDCDVTESRATAPTSSFKESHEDVAQSIKNPAITATPAHGRSKAPPEQNSISTCRAEQIKAAEQELADAELKQKLAHARLRHQKLLLLKKAKDYPT